MYSLYDEDNIVIKVEQTIEYPKDGKSRTINYILYYIKSLPELYIQYQPSTMCGNLVLVESLPTNIKDIVNNITKDITQYIPPKLR